MGTTKTQPDLVSGTRSVFLAEDDADLRLLLRLLIEAEPDLCIAGEAASGRATVDAITGGNVPDILLVDVNMPSMTDASELRRLRHAHPRMQVVVHSGEDEAEGRRRLGDIGPVSYVVKGRPDRLLEALRESGR